MSLSEAIIEMLDELTWKPGACDICPPDDTETLVADAQGDMESGGGFLGTFCRRHLELALAMGEHQLAQRTKSMVERNRLDTLYGPPGGARQRSVRRARAPLCADS